MTYLLSFLAFWLACGFVAAGFVFSHFQDRWSDLGQSYMDARRPEHAALAWWSLAFGLMALIGSLGVVEYRHGWRKWW